MVGTVWGKEAFVSKVSTYMYQGSHGSLKVLEYTWKKFESLKMRNILENHNLVLESPWKLRNGPWKIKSQTPKNFQ